MSLGVLCHELGCPLGLAKERGWMAPSLDNTGASLAVEQSLCDLCPKHSPLWEPLLVYPCSRSVRGLGSMCTRVPAVRVCARVPAVLGVHTCACSLGRTHVCLQSGSAHMCLHSGSAHGCLQCWVCTRVPVVLGVHTGSCSLGVHTGACSLGVHMGACSLGVHTGSCSLGCTHGCLKSGCAHGCLQSWAYTRVHQFVMGSPVRAWWLSKPGGGGDPAECLC